MQATGVDSSNLGKFHILRHVIRQRLEWLLRYKVILPFDITLANTPTGVNNLYVEQNHICRTNDGPRACCTEGNLDISTEPCLTPAYHCHVISCVITPAYQKSQLF